MRRARRDRERLYALLAVEANITPAEAQTLTLSQIAEITHLLRDKYRN